MICFCDSNRNISIAVTRIYCDLDVIYKLLTLKRMISLKYQEYHFVQKCRITSKNNIPPISIRPMLLVVLQLQSQYVASSSWPLSYFPYQIVNIYGKYFDNFFKLEQRHVNKLILCHPLQSCVAIISFSVYTMPLAFVNGAVSCILASAFSS